MAVLIGLRDLYVAKLTSDTLAGAAYALPEKIIGAITANVNPNSSMETLFADDGPMETATALGNIELELAVSDLTLEQQALLLGNTWDDVKGGLIKKGADVPPWFGVGFRALKSDGTYRYVWLDKGMFSEPEQNHETKKDSVSFQTPTIKATFVKRVFDDSWEAIADSADTAAATVIAAWFTKVDGGLTSVTTATA